MNIYLIGMRAAGKTSVGRRLASKMERAFIDMDGELAREFGQSISGFVQAEGWGAFRSREAALLKRIAKTDGFVVATGGGVIVSEQNIACMRASGWVVWLNAGLRTLRARMAADRNTALMRPALSAAENAVAELASLLEDRRAAYRRAMHVVVETDGRSQQEICRQVADLFAAESNLPPGA